MSSRRWSPSTFHPGPLRPSQAAAQPRPPAAGARDRHRRGGLAAGAGCRRRSSGAHRPDRRRCSRRRRALVDPRAARTFPFAAVRADRVARWPRPRPRRCAERTAFVVHALGQPCRVRDPRAGAGDPLGDARPHRRRVGVADQAGAHADLPRRGLRRRRVLLPAHIPLEAVPPRPPPASSARRSSRR